MPKLKSGDIIQFSACMGNPNGIDVWKYWSAIVVKVHDYKDEFWNVTLMWDSGEVSRENYHYLEFEVIND